MSKNFLRQTFLQSSISTITVLGTLTTLTGQSLAVSGFTGVYDYQLWNTSTTATGSVTADASQATLQLDSGARGESIDYTIPIDSSRAGTLQFSWQLASLDTAGNQGIGYLKNGNYTQLALNDGSDDGLVSTSPVTVSVANGDTFGFSFLVASDSTSSTGQFTVNDFSFTPVPLETDALPVVIGFTFFGAGMWLKRRKIGN